MHLWRYVTTRFPANIERSSLKTSMHLYCDVALLKFRGRYVAVQIWRVKELFVPGIVAITIKLACVFNHKIWANSEIRTFALPKSECPPPHPFSYALEIEFSAQSFETLPAFRTRSFTVWWEGG